jgi:hypothetical protein
MADDKKPLLMLSGETLKNIGVAVSITVTLFGVIKFAVSKIDEYDTYAARLAKLEARDQAFTALSDASKQSAFQTDSNKNDLATIKLRIDNMSQDIVGIRLNYERLKTILENRK